MGWRGREVVVGERGREEGTEERREGEEVMVVSWWIQMDLGRMRNGETRKYGLKKIRREWDNDRMPRNEKERKK